MRSSSSSSIFFFVDELGRYKSLYFYLGVVSADNFPRLQCAPPAAKVCARAVCVGALPPSRIPRDRARDDFFPLRSLLPPSYLSSFPSRASV